SLPPPPPPLFPYPPLFRSPLGEPALVRVGRRDRLGGLDPLLAELPQGRGDEVAVPHRPDPGARRNHHRQRAFLLELRQPEDRDRSEEHTSELQSRGHLVCR